MSPYHNKYWAKLLTLKNPSSSIGSLTRSIANAKVDLNPHQIYAALFALKSPLSKGVILADEVGLGKTIEAGIVISQKWAENKRKILLIVPAFLRQQWKQELLEKFFIPAKVVDGKKFKEFSDIGIKNPFDLENEVVICSYNFASNKSDFIRLVEWDLVIFDEAHRLRNIYKNSNKIAKNLSKALRPYFKVLLTATPLQNNLMELYGLVSVIDEHVFASESSFKDNFRETGEDQFWLLKKRLNLLCNRTLRKQVKEYIPFTKRISITWDFTPYEDEQKLYEAVSDYLRKDNAFGFTSGQKNLMILVFQKLLASSTFAISNTLNKMVLKLEQMADSNDLLDDDYDAFESVEEEWKNDDDQVKQLSLDIESELQELRNFANLANQIKLNAKGDELIKALKHAFEKTEMLGALKKAVIFTESKITQKYLADLLSNNGYRDQIALINGVNNDPLSKQIHGAWLKKHSGSDKITGSKTVDVKAAIVDYFKNNASILIATEAAAEGINLQFCSLVVNYDLPWNPQRVEQRIGRCHRYGQKHDVVVVNFINQNNEADKRVYELLNEKFQLFNGVFGASDEVLGILESGIDIEKRISEIYQTCRTKEEINTAFDEIQREFNDKIQSNYKNARQALLEHFDEDVSKRLKLKDEEAKISLSDREKWLINLTKSSLKDKVTFHSPVNFTYENKNYYLDWKKSEEHNGIFYRENHELATKILNQELKKDLQTGQIIFKYSDYPNKISVLDSLIGSKGYLELSVLKIDSLDTEEYLVFTATTSDGVSLDQETCKKLFQIPASKVNKDIGFNDINLSEIRSENINKVLKNVSLENQSHFDSYILKLDQWAEDLKDDLERDLKEKQKQIQEAKKASRSAGTLKDKLEAQKKIKSLEKDRNRMRKELFNAQDNIEKERDELIQTTEKKLEPDWSINTLFQITWEVR